MFSTLLQKRHRLHMRRMRKQIHRLNHSQIISPLQKFSEITGECGGIAGNIDDLLRFVAKNGFDDFGMQARARGIQNDAIEGVLPSRRELFLEHLLCGAAVETDIADLVLPRRFKRVFDDRLFALHTDNSLRKTRKVLADRPDAAVAIEHRLATAQIRHLRNRLIEFLRCEGIRLEEREGRELEREIEEVLADERLTFEDVDLRILHLIVQSEVFHNEKRRGIRVLPKPHEVLEEGLELFFSRLHHEAEHLLTRMDAAAKEQVPEHPL